MKARIGVGLDDEDRKELKQIEGERRAAEDGFRIAMRDLKRRRDAVMARARMRAMRERKAKA